MTMIVIVETVRNPNTGMPELVVSYGIDLLTDQVVPLPNVHPSMLGAKFDMTYGEYVI